MLAADSDQKFMYILKKPFVYGPQKSLGRAVKWTADRTQAFLGDAHGRDHISEVKLALDKNNSITGLRVDTLANLGAYLSAFAYGDANLSSRNATFGCL
jgi:CO/xanthine dehydrogenase Mo-binding subunit